MARFIHGLAELGGLELYLEHENTTPRGVRHAEELEDEGARDLVGRVGDADVVLRKVELDGVAQEDFELLLRGGSHDTLGDLGGHPRVQLDGVQLLGLLEYAHANVARSGADLEHGVGGLEVRLLDDRVCYARVLENVLAHVCVKLEDIVLAGGCCAGGLLGRALVGSGGGRRCVFALGGRFAHVVGGDRAGKADYIVFITGTGSCWK